MRRRLTALVLAAFLPLVLPVASFAATTTSRSAEQPSGHDSTLTSIFIVALGIPLVLTILTLIDIAAGRHTNRGH